jgi:hypothetical protein
VELELGLGETDPEGVPPESLGVGLAAGAGVIDA